MIAKHLKKTGIVNNDFESVVLGRRTARFLDPTYKVPREEIEEIIKEAMVATPSAIDSCPYKFLVIESDEAKKKLDDIMWPLDKSRTLQSSFCIIPMADRQWADRYDDQVAGNERECPPYYAGLGPVVDFLPTWLEILQANNGIGLDKSVNFQAGLVAQSLMIVARAHGLDTGFMDAWSPEQDLGKIFDVDMDRYVAHGVIAFGKSVGITHDNYRPEIEDAAEFL